LSLRPFLNPIGELSPLLNIPACPADRQAIKYLLLDFVLRSDKIGAATLIRGVQNARGNGESMCHRIFNAASIWR
jgi:hypothetical protein